MKNIILASAVLVSSFGAYAGDYCEGISRVAELTMSLRQAGMPASETYKASKASADTPEVIRHIFHEMVKQAYFRPVWVTGEAQRKEVSEFSSIWFMNCLYALRGLSNE